MTTIDNQLSILTAGQADWDADTDFNFQQIERGYHVTQRAGTAINTGMALWCDSGGFFKPFDPNSSTIYPMALAFTAAASGDSMRALAWGIVRSLGINSAVVAGKRAWVSAATPGVIVGSSAIQLVPVGLGLPGGGILFNPAKIAVSAAGTLASLTDVNTNGVADGEVLTWADATSKWVSAPQASGGRTQIGSMDDVDRSGLADNSILKWSNASSKFTMRVDSTGGGTNVGSPPSVVQFTYVRSSNQPTFVTSPSSGNYLVAMGYSNAGHTPAAGWTTYAENISGTDFADIYVKPLTAPGTLVQTPVTVGDSTMQIMLFEVQGGKGVTPTLVAPGSQNGAAPPGPALIGPAVPNLVDCITLFAMELLSSASSMTVQYNVNSLLMANSGATRQGCAGWSWSDRPLGQHLVGVTSTSGQGKGLALILSS